MRFYIQWQQSRWKDRLGLAKCQSLKRIVSTHSFLKEAFHDALTPVYWVPQLNAVIAFLTIIIINWGVFRILLQLAPSGHDFACFWLYPCCLSKWRSSGSKLFVIQLCPLHMNLQVANFLSIHVSQFICLMYSVTMQGFSLRRHCYSLRHRIQMQTSTQRLQQL